MRLHSPIECLASSINHAAYMALPELEYPQRDWETFNTWSEQQQVEARKGKIEFPTRLVKRRPLADECEVQAMFPQTWGSTALGFGGVGGAAMTPAYTVVVQGPGGEQVVYWSGRFAYVIAPNAQTQQQREAWASDLQAHNTVSRAEAVGRYGASLEQFVRI